jgi:O-acetyl-ADP-ribose deacetylase (regulator of RNase III)
MTTTQENRQAIYQIESTKFEVLYADITSLPTDVIVSSDDNYISMGGGVSATILRMAGDRLREEVKKHLPMKIGDVAVTSAGNLNAKFIFHGITIDWDNYVYANEEVVKSIVEKSLNLAETLGVKRISFPALATGVAKFPFQIAAQTMTEAIAKYLSNGSKIENVTLCLYARGGVRASDIDLFYEHSVGLMSIFAQNNRLDVLLSEMKELVNSIGRDDLIVDIRNLQDKIKKANKAITKQMSDESTKPFEGKAHSKALNDLQDEIKHYTDKEVEQYEDRQLEGKLLRTKLSGLYTTLNIKQAQLNNYQIEEAKYGGIMVPPRLSIAISELKSEMEILENQIQDIRVQQSKLGNQDPSM